MCRNCFGHQDSQSGGYQDVESPCYIPNSIPIDEDHETLNYSGGINSIPRLVFIFSGLRPWHGLDNFIELAENSIGELNFDLITGFDAQGIEFPQRKTLLFLEKPILKIFRSAVVELELQLYEKNMTRHVL